jgi:hypothetical protein
MGNIWPKLLRPMRINMLFSQLALAKSEPSTPRVRRGRSLYQFCCIKSNAREKLEYPKKGAVGFPLFILGK